MTTTIKLRHRGPLVVEGELEIYDEDGNLLIEGKKKLRLCRCGASQTPPFCDGGHYRLPAPETEE